MCGLAGLVATDRRVVPAPEAAAAVGRMLADLAHRGPDGEGIRCLPGAVLGHRRLAVIDLSDRAAQPMELSCSGAPGYWIVFNGEIYNHVELRAALAGRGHRFRTASDTEVILHLYEESGEGCLADLRGMFALAIWDAPRGRLLLARDRMGEKPLYYHRHPDGLAFASEIGPLAGLARARGLPVELDPVSIRRYLALGYVPGPRTALTGITKLPAAHLLIWEAGGAAVRRWWSLPDAAPEPGADPAGLEEELERTLDESVRLRMRSDVPLGVFLSGGIDSGIVASGMTRSAGPGGDVRTFTVGFGEADYDELSAAASVARALGTRHREIRIAPTVAQTADLLPELARRLDQPLADSSALAVYHLAREVRRHVTVALSGDGGDELFFGYDRYRAHRLADRLGAAGRALLGWPPLRSGLSALLPGSPARRNLAGRGRRFLEAAPLAPLERNDVWVACLDGAIARSTLDETLLGLEDPMTPLREAYAGAPAGSPLAAIQRADLLVWLPDDILHKADAATMAHGLEARAPFLDHRVVETAMRIPLSMTLGSRQGKMILRKVFGPRLPPGVRTGRKKGFGLPLDHWLRGGLAGHCRDLLLDRSTLSRGLLVRAGVERLLAEHQQGRASHEKAIWALVMLEHWIRAVPEARIEPAGRAAVEVS